MVFVCNLRNIHSLANVVILFAIKTCQPCHYIKPIARVYTRECHENKNTRFWATYDINGLNTIKILLFGKILFLFILNLSTSVIYIECVVLKAILSICTTLVP